MSTIEQELIFEAIRNAVEATVLELGIDALRSLSMFPSSTISEIEIPIAA